MPIAMVPLSHSLQPLSSYPGFLPWMGVTTVRQLNLRPALIRHSTYLFLLLASLFPVGTAVAQLTPSQQTAIEDVEKRTRELKQAYGKRDFETISQRQQKMTNFRNALIELRIFPAFTVAMNLLGFEGRFHPSHMAPLADPDHGKVKQILQEAELVS